MAFRILRVTILIVAVEQSWAFSVHSISQRISRDGVSANRPRLEGTTKDWDAIIADEEDGGRSMQEDTPPDMRYIPRNCNRSAKTFTAIKSAGGPAADIYGCVSTQNTEAVFWFLGKVAHISDVSLEQCVSRQWYLIQQHAANLRPIELFPAVTSRSLELWCAPADSELEVAYNRPTSAAFQKMSQDVVGAVDMKTNLIGFQGEVYDRGEDGFRTWRLTANGMPSRAEIGGPDEDDDSFDFSSDDDTDARALTDEEMKRLSKVLEGKDIQDIYEEQQRRKNEGP